MKKIFLSIALILLVFSPPITAQDKDKITLQDTVLNETSSTPSLENNMFQMGHTDFLVPMI